MDDIRRISFKKDTTLAMLFAAQQHGFQLFYLQQHDIFLENSVSFGNSRPLRVTMDESQWFEIDEQRTIALHEFDVILMRKDPPFDMEFIYTSYLLEAAEKKGALVLNPPQALRDHNEKLFATQFPQCCPALTVSRDPVILKKFHQTHQDVIFKPLDGMGGQGIFRVRPGDADLNVIIETLCQQGQQTVMAQKFIPDIKNGDKRILMIDGEPVDYCLARIPAEGENRGNLAAGGSGLVQKLSDKDKWIASQVGPTLKERGLLFVGLDVIGDYLTEINVTSPTCLREISAASGIDVADLFIQAINKKLS